MSDILRAFLYNAAMELRIKKVRPTAKVPFYAHATDAGMDLFAAETVVLNPGAIIGVPSGIACAIPEGCVGLIWEKSGLAAKGIAVFGGVIDSAYRGEIIVLLRNVGKEPYTFEQGNKVAQMLIQPVLQPTLVEVEELDETDRGAGGFGSTGV